MTTLKEFIISGITDKFLESEKTFLEKLSDSVPDTEITLVRMINTLNTSKAWISATCFKEGDICLLPVSVKKVVEDTEKTYRDFCREIDYLNNFLSVLLRSNVPKTTVLEYIPEHVLRSYEESCNTNFNFIEKTDESITPEFIEDKYTNEIYLLQKYLIYLLM